MNILHPNTHIYGMIGLISINSHADETAAVAIADNMWVQSIPRSSCTAVLSDKDL